MNLTLHMVGKDFRRLHLLFPLVGWWGLVILQGFLVATFARLPHHSPPADMMLEFSITLLAWLVALLKMGLLVLIVSQLVQQDSTVGSTAFWLSRPVSGKRLLAGKSLFLALTVILPAFLIEVLLLLLHGVTLYDTVRSIPQILLFQCLMLALLMMLAALTRNLARLMFVGILAVVGLLLVQYIFSVFLRWLDPYVFQPQQNALMQTIATVVRRNRWDDSLYFSGLIGFLLFFLVVALVVVCHQYLTRRTKKSMILASSVFPGVLLFMVFWTWDFWPDEYPLSEGILDPEQVTARIQEKSLRIHRWHKRWHKPGHKEGWLLHGFVTVDNLPAGLVALPGRFTASLVSTSSETLDQYQGSTSYDYRDRSPRFQRYREGDLDMKKAALLSQSLGGVEFLNSEKFEGKPHLELLRISQEFHNRYSGDEMVYEAEMHFLVQRDAITRMRLEPGVRYDRGSDHAAILAVTSQNDAWIVHLRETSHKLTLDDWKAVRYFLVNVSRKEALFGQRSFGPDSLSSLLLFSDIYQVLEIGRPTLSFDLPSETSPIDATWLQGAELVRVETRDLGWFSKRVRIEDFVLERIPVSPESSGSTPRQEAPVGAGE